jgi:hypothetical protein
MGSSDPIFLPVDCGYFEDKSQCSGLMRKRKISTIHEKWILCCGMCKSCQIANRLIRIDSRTVAEGITAY